MDARAEGGHVLNEVDNNACQDTRIRRVQEQEHEHKGAGDSPYGGEQQVTGPVIHSTGKLGVVLVEHGNEPC